MTNDNKGHNFNSIYFVEMTTCVFDYLYENNNLPSSCSLKFNSSPMINNFKSLKCITQKLTKIPRSLNKNNLKAQ